MKSIDDKSSGPLYCTNAPLLTPEVTIPRQTAQCSIVVVDRTGTPPSLPTISPVAGAACYITTPYNMNVSATDPEGDRIRYGIDWNADGGIDQFLPATGYVASGTVVSFSRTYSTIGSKTVKVVAFDESGNMSAWATGTFSCGDTPDSNTVISGGDSTETSGSGSGTGTGTGDGNGVADVTLRVVPSLVRSGFTTRITWSASNVVSCTVTAPNGDSWTGLSSPIGGTVSQPITGRTVYTLVCRTAAGDTVTRAGVVNVLPTWQEQ
jgi:hypothetical protein